MLCGSDGGIEELTEDLSGGKILYAYVKVIDPNTNLPKFVFINWVIIIIFFIILPSVVKIIIIIIIIIIVHLYSSRSPHVKPTCRATIGLHIYC